jgi:TRAP-type mannitol/chloroaromatic compound transport system permease large subunit
MVLGTMMLGVATPTESGAMGALGAVVLAVIRNPEFTRKDRLVYRLGMLGLGLAVVLSALFYGEEAGVSKAVMPFLQAGLVVAYIGIVWLIVRASRIRELRDLIVLGYQSTMRLTSMVVFILIGSTCFSVVFMGVDGGVWVEHLFTSLPGGWIGFLIVVNVFIFFLAFFLDFFEIAFIVVPMLAPVAQKVLSPVLLDSMGSPEAAASAALVWFGVMLCVNMQTSFMHPPFGFALFYLRGVAPKEVKSSDIYWGALPWVGLQLIMVALVIAFPQMVTGLLDKGVAMSADEGLVIERPATDEDKKDEETPQLNFSTDDEKKDGESPQLNFSTDTEKEKK